MYRHFAKGRLMARKQLRFSQGFSVVLRGSDQGLYDPLPRGRK
jgi:hypothetical protein